MAIEDIKPTKSELIQIKHKIELSNMGYKLLKMKRDGLMHEFFELLPRAKKIRGSLTDQYKVCVERMSLAMAMEGKVAVRSIAYTQKTTPFMKLGSRNIMGVVVPKIEGEHVEKLLHERGYGIIGTSTFLDEVVGAYQDLLNLMLEAAEVETSMRRLVEEIDKTKRRVNALEFKVIPELEEAAKYITLRLEEVERENIFRLKRIKARSQREEAEKALEALEVIEE